MGYYLDRDGDITNPAHIFVAIQTPEEYSSYSPIGQHSQLKDIGYLNECTEITRDKYLEVSSHLYTPREYL
jgi:hypothetical protein